MSLQPHALCLSLVLAFAAGLPAFAQDDAIRLETRDGSAHEPRTTAPTHSTTVTSSTGPTATVAIRDDVAPLPVPAPATIASDGEILGMLTAIDDHQIALAQLAQDKGVTSPWHDYARDIVREQRAQSGETRRLSGKVGINAYDSNAVLLLRQRAADERAQLRVLDGVAFERGFVDAMLQINNDAVIAVDGVLLPASRNDLVHAHLRAARERFAGNLDRTLLLDGGAQAAR